MLLGVRPELRGALVRQGHRLRIYVPFGRRWYEYSIRRLQENPKLAGYLAPATLKSLRPSSPPRPRALEEPAPVIWAEAEGCRVTDSEGRSYIDLSGGFGVAALGHRNPELR